MNNGRVFITSKGEDYLQRIDFRARNYNIRTQEKILYAIKSNPGIQYEALAKEVKYDYNMVAKGDSGFDGIMNFFIEKDYIDVR